MTDSERSQTIHDLKDLIEYAKGEAKKRFQRQLEDLENEKSR